MGKVGYELLEFPLLLKDRWPTHCKMDCSQVPEPLTDFNETDILLLLIKIEVS